MATMKVGVIGCGKISPIYLRNIQGFYDNVEVAACADLVVERAAERAKEYDVPIACSVEELLANDEIEIVVNLTIPAAHMDVALAAIDAGKHVHNEKPLTVTRDEGKRLLAAAADKGLRVGCAPDTFLGAAFQTCRQLIDTGAIGEPVAAAAFFACHGHESWHPDPEFYYKLGGGPMFDMGPYYLSALISLLGPARRISGSARISSPERTITSEPKNGQKIAVEVPTHVAGTVDFAAGAIATIITSFDVWGHHLPQIEIHGSEATLALPSPNGFSGKVHLRKPGVDGWTEVTHTHGYVGQCRAAAVADMAEAVATGSPHRCSGELAYHVLDIMHAFHDASDQGVYVELESTCAQPAAMPVGLRPNPLDD